MAGAAAALILKITEITTQGHSCQVASQGQSCVRAFHAATGTFRGSLTVRTQSHTRTRQNIPHDSTCQITMRKAGAKDSKVTKAKLERHIQFIAL